MGSLLIDWVSDCIGTTPGMGLRGDEEVFIIVTMWPLIVTIRGLEWIADTIMKLLEWNRRIGR